MHGSTPANTACELTTAGRAVAVTCEQIIRERIPNLFRLYLNPYVAQACYCLGESIVAAWPAAVESAPFQVFLANGFEEALSGAIKLARYDRCARRLPTSGLVLDDTNRLEHFAFTNLAGLGRLTYLPEIEVMADLGSLVTALSDPKRRPGFVVVPAWALYSADCPLVRVLSSLSAGDDRPLLIVCADRDRLFDRDPDVCDPRILSPDVVVFDESLVDDGVPFGAFAAPSRLYGRWNRRGMATFHSTTYQPNTISTLHLMNCLRRSEPEFIDRHSTPLDWMERDPAFCLAEFRRRYSPSLGKLIKAAGFDRPAVRAVGHYIELPDRRLFDAVGGVACSVRGHNPDHFTAELEQTGELDACHREVTTRLQALTGLPHVTPAVSGASAVEHALKIGLAARHPRTHVLALEGGYGGKTLFALTGTAKPSLKAGIGPLYPHVVYVDPFAGDAADQIEAVCNRLPVGVIQVELVQGVGGVRAVPDDVLRRVQQVRERHDCLLLVDEVQTGVYRTGPFVRSSDLNIRPDLLTIGKGTSDMMFPFGLTLHSAEVQQRLDARGCTLPQTFGERYGYEIGYRTVLNTLRRAEQRQLGRRVREAGERFASLLSAKLKSCRNVRAVRYFGLLIGIELHVERLPQRWLKRLMSQLYLLAMMQHRPFPVIAGFCQYQPHVLKVTPPLSIADEEIDQVCETLAAVLSRSPARLASSALLRRLTRRRTRPQQATSGSVGS